MCADKSKHPNEGEKSSLRLYLVSATCVAILDTDEYDHAQISYAGLVNAESVEEAKLVAHHYLLELILESNMLHSELQFDSVDVVEVFQDELKEMMKIARKLPRAGG